MSEYFLLLIATVVLPAAALVAIGIWLVRRTKRGGGSPSP
jgi:lipopolysaccharide export LptBFGC system permease protein LptF